MRRRWVQSLRPSVEIDEEEENKEEEMWKHRLYKLQVNHTSIQELYLICFYSVVFLLFLQ